MTVFADIVVAADHAVTRVLPKSKPEVTFGALRRPKLTRYRFGIKVIRSAPS